MIKLVRKCLTSAGGPIHKINGLDAVSEQQYTNTKFRTGIQHEWDPDTGTLTYYHGNEARPGFRYVGYGTVGGDKYHRFKDDRGNYHTLYGEGWDDQVADWVTSGVGQGTKLPTVTVTAKRPIKTSNLVSMIDTSDLDKEVENYKNSLFTESLKELKLMGEKIPYQLEMGNDGQLHSIMTDEQQESLARNGTVPQNREYQGVIDGMHNKYYYRQGLLALNMIDTENSSSYTGYDSNFNKTTRKFSPIWKDMSAMDYINKINYNLSTTPIFDGLISQVDGKPYRDEKKYSLPLGYNPNLGKEYNFRLNTINDEGVDTYGKNGVSVNGKNNYFAAVFSPAYKKSGNLPYQYLNDGRHELTHSIDMRNSASPMVTKVDQIKLEMGDEWYSNPNDKSKDNLYYNGGADEAHARTEELWEYLRREQENKYNTDENFRRLFDGYTLQLKLQYWRNFYNRTFSEKDFRKGGKYYNFYRSRFPALSPKAVVRILNEVAQNDSNTESPDYNIYDDRPLVAKKGNKLKKRKKVVSFKGIATDNGFMI